MTVSAEPLFVSQREIITSASNIEYNRASSAKEPAFDTIVSDKHDPRGSIWRRWDLHVHTPKSFEHQYPGGDTPEGWNTYLDQLRQLPPTIKVVGINDYVTVDGYEIVQAEHQRGNLPNIDLILPVIELRLSTFSGTDTSWNKV